MAEAVQAQVESAEQFGSGPEAVARRYIAEIELYEEQTKDWRERGDKIVKRYRDERPDDISRATRRFNLLWSNLQTTLPIYYAKTPKSDVQRRFKDQDPVARVACELAERALDYHIECDDRFDRAMKQSVEDFGLPGRGTTWERYVPHFRGVEQRVDLKPKASANTIADKGVQLSNENDDCELYSDANGNEYKRADVQKDERGPYVSRQVNVVDYEETLTDYVNWKDFGHNFGARTWEEVYLVWRCAYLTRKELHDRFDATLGKEKVDLLPLDYEPKEIGGFDEQTKALFRKARIYECWDKSCRKAFWVHKAYNERPLDERKDPLGLSEFFPCPKPLYATTTNTTLVPVPDYAQYQDQAAEIDDCTARIAVIEKAIKVRGLYPANIDSIRTLLTQAGDNDMVGLDQAAIATVLGMSGGDLSKIVYFWPVDILIKCVQALTEIRRQLIDDVYQITGFGDILRGVSEPRETATASELKSQWGSLRVKDRQKEVQRFARDSLRIKFEIIFNHYEDETIWLMANASNIPEIQKAGKEAAQKAMQPMRGMMGHNGGPAMPPQTSPEMLQKIEADGQRAMFAKALGLLRDAALRHFKVDIETDSTVAPDDGREKQRVNELLGALGPFFAQVAPVVKEAPMFAPFIGELLMMVARRYKASSTIESTLETAVSAFMQSPPSAGGDGAADAKAKMITEETKRMQIKADDQRALLEASEREKDRVIERGELAIEGLALQRDATPQVTVQ